MRGGPIEPGEDAGKRSGKIRHAVGNHRQAGIGETRRIAVGIDDDAFALRSDAGEHALQDRRAADAKPRFVAAAHAARQAAGKHEAESRGHAHARFGLIVMHSGLAAVLGAFVLDISEVLIEHDALCAGKRDEALAAGAADQASGSPCGRDRRPRR